MTNGSVGASTLIRRLFQVCDHLGNRVHVRERLGDDLGQFGLEFHDLVVDLGGGFFHDALLLMEEGLELFDLLLNALDLLGD